MINQCLLIIVDLMDKEEQKVKRCDKSCSLFGRSPYHKFEILKKIAWPFRVIKDVILRAKYGFCPRDTWNLDTYLATVLQNSLIWFSKNHHGYPGTMTNEEYEEKLAQMIEYTKEYLADYDDYFAPDTRDTEDYEALMKYYREMRKKKEDSIDAGFKLLRELFETLWD